MTDEVMNVPEVELPKTLSEQQLPKNVRKSVNPASPK